MLKVYYNSFNESETVGGSMVATWVNTIFLLKGDAARFKANLKETTNDGNNCELIEGAGANTVFWGVVGTNGSDFYQKLEALADAIIAINIDTLGDLDMGG